LLLLHAFQEYEDAAIELNELLFNYQVQDLEGDPEPAVLVWCQTHFADALALVPARRRKPFARGLIDAYEELEHEGDVESTDDELEGSEK
jgi:hypothetical protein